MLSFCSMGLESRPERTKIHQPIIRQILPRTPQMGAVSPTRPVLIFLPS